MSSRRSIAVRGVTSAFLVYNWTQFPFHYIKKSWVHKLEITNFLSGGVWAKKSRDFQTYIEKREEEMEG